MRNFPKYCLIILIMAFISACTNLTQPTMEERFQVSGISKWKIDNNTNEKINILFSKKFDNIGRVICEEEFNENGDLISKSEFTYDKNHSTEIKSIYNSNTGTTQQYIIESEYDKDMRVIKQVLYDIEGNVSDIIVFNYDSRGNIIEKSYEYSSKNKNESINFDYEYTNSGEVLERVTNNEFGSVARDSMSYNSSNKSFLIFKFDSTGVLTGYTEYTYNSLGNIVNELVYNSEKNITAKFLYEYTYF